MLESKQISYHSLLNWPQGQLPRDGRDGKVKLLLYGLQGQLYTEWEVYTHCWNSHIIACQNTLYTKM